MRGTRWGGEGQNGMERERDREGRNKKTKRTERKKKLKGTEKDQMERRAIKTEGI